MVSRGTTGQTRLAFVTLDSFYILSFGLTLQLWEHTEELREILESCCHHLFELRFPVNSLSLSLREATPLRRLTCQIFLKFVAEVRPTQNCFDMMRTDHTSI